MLIKSSVSILIMLLICVVGYADFEYRWEYDGTPLGQETFDVPDPIQVNINGTDIGLNNGTAGIDLAQSYKVMISDEFTNMQASMLLKEFRKMPGYSMYGRDRIKESLWYIIESDIKLPNNILIYTKPDRDTVLISESVFDHKSAELNGILGNSGSLDLFHAVVRYVTNNGNDSGRAEDILTHRYAVMFGWYCSELTQHTTNETCTSFEPFKPEELVKLIFMLEQFPEGMHKTAGLNYVLRRRDGLRHPLYPQAAAVAWTSAGYIEFMESAFNSNDLHHIHRLILHEKAHFLWAHVFDDQLKSDWIDLGGWYQDDNKWHTTHQTEFVSAYAHGINPNEDMAETISYYIINPDKLRTHAPDKYAFVQNRIMHGTRYISTIPDHLTFEVYNLWPDYVYPGKVISVHIKVDGKPEEDKHVRIKMTTHSESELDYGIGIMFRLFSKIETFIDPRLHAVNEYGDRVDSSNIYVGEFTLSKYMPAGYWTLGLLTTTDMNNLSRYESNRDIGFRLYIDNPLEDITPPEYIEESLDIWMSYEDDGQFINFQWLAKDDNVMNYANISINNETNNNVHSIYAGGWIDPFEWDQDGYQIISLKKHIPEYQPDGIYSISELSMRDLGENWGSYPFTKDVKDRPSIKIETSTPDTTPPELDLNKLSISGRPYDADNLNGKTIVELTYYVKDDISYYTFGSMYIKDPAGIYHHYYLNNKKYSGDPSEWREYKKVIILPEGSVPGTWGVASMSIMDRAGNRNEYDFTKNVRFDVIESSSASPAATISSTELLPNYPNPFNPETWIPYRLSKPASVTISIYDINGDIVRLLSLGHKDAGSYVSQNKSAYWDGRNSNGDSVSSGIYFYTLNSGQYTHTRKMVIVK